MQTSLFRRIESCIFLALTRVKKEIAAAAVLDEFFHRDGTQPAEFFILAPRLCPVSAAPFLNGEQRNVGIVDTAEYDLLSDDLIERARAPIPTCTLSPSAQEIASPIKMMSQPEGVSRAAPQ